MPPLQFGQWHSWHRRGQIVGRTNPGIYAYSVTLKSLEGTQVDWIDVSYIGKSVGKGGMNTRWSELHRCITGGAGNGPGKRMYAAFGIYSKWSLNLFVAALPIDGTWMDLRAEDTLKFGWVAYLEYEAISEFGKKAHKRRPYYNTSLMLSDRK